MAEHGNIRIAEIPIDGRIGHWHSHLHSPDVINVLVVFGLQDELLHAPKERRDFEKHSPVQISIRRHLLNTFDKVIVPIPQIEVDFTGRPSLSEFCIKTLQIGHCQVKDLNSRRIDRDWLGSRGKREFRARVVSQSC